MVCFAIPFANRSKTPRLRVWPVSCTTTPPSDYLQVDWWDRDEGQLPNPEIQYPQLDRAAAFACTASACSMPVFNSAEIEQAVRAALAP